MVTTKMNILTVNKTTIKEQQQVYPKMDMTVLGK